MKICWDNLENIKISNKGYFRDPIKKRTYIYVDSCKTCKEPFLKIIRSKGLFCSRSCKSSSKNHSFYGKHHSKEIKRKMSKNHTGKNNPFYNKKHTKESIEKISKSLSGKKHPMYGKRDNLSPLYGRKQSEETKRKISKSQKGSKGNNWDGGYYSKNIPKYDLYAPQIEWCEEVRRNKADRNIIEVKCAYCGKWFVPTVINIHNRNQYLKGNYISERRLYCSEGCRQECPIYGQYLYPKGFKPATSREVQPELRQMVLKRDNYTCQKCGSTKSLHCHHLEGILWEPLLSADIDMCITLCKSCHKEAHKLPDCSYNDLKCKAA